MSITAPKKTPVDPYKEGMTPEESSNYDTLRSSNKSWSPDDARDMATNPSKRLPPVERPKSRAGRMYKDKQ